MGKIVVLYRFPDLHIHTHPQITTIEKVVNVQPGSSKGRASQLSGAHEKRLGYSPDHFMLPSVTDMRTYGYGVAGRVGNLVSSVCGNFLLLEKDIFRPFDPDEEDGRRVTEQLHKANELARTQSADQALRTMTVATAMVAAEHSVCYFSDDPQSSQLQRILPVE